MEFKAGSAIRPGTKVVLTIEATVIQAFEGSATFLAYGGGNEYELVIRPGTDGVAIRTA